MSKTPRADRRNSFLAFPPLMVPVYFMEFESENVGSSANPEADQYTQGCCFLLKCTKEQQVCTSYSITSTFQLPFSFHMFVFYLDKWFLALELLKEFLCFLINYEKQMINILQGNER